jgi:DNA-binding MarR family transcriptional regulator
LPVNTIGPKVWLTPGSISVAVDRLEKNVLVKRKNTDDRRVRLVELSAKGGALFTKTFRSPKLAPRGGRQSARDDHLARRDYRLA